MAMFTNDLYEEFAERAQGLIAYHAAMLGEIDSIVATLPADADADAWFEAWKALADRVGAVGKASETGRHPISAADAFNRAATYLRTAYLPLYGSPVDPRLKQAFNDEMDYFAKALTLEYPGAERLTIPSPAGDLPGWFIPAPGADAGEVKTLICTNGYDSTMAEMFAYLGTPALRRGYNVVIYDGPGQGHMLINQGVPFRADWEVVITAVVDAIISRPDVDASRIAHEGWSFGGYLSVRGTSGEPRIAATIADPGQLNLGLLIEGMLGLDDDQKRVFPDLPADFYQGVEKFIEAVPSMRWRIMQRAYWVHGVSSMAQYAKVALEFSVEERLALIKTPVFISLAEGDGPGIQGAEVAERLGELATLVNFTVAEGAGGHCEVPGRPLFEQRALDWLDTQVATVGSPRS